MKDLSETIQNQMKDSLELFNIEGTSSGHMQKAMGMLLQCETLIKRTFSTSFTMTLLISRPSDSHGKTFSYK